MMLHNVVYAVASKLVIGCILTCLSEVLQGPHVQKVHTHKCSPSEVQNTFSPWKCAVLRVKSQTGVRTFLPIYLHVSKNKTIGETEKSSWQKRIREMFSQLGVNKVIFRADIDCGIKEIPNYKVNSNTAL